MLLLADTHLGFDLPVRPRVEYRRRGPDFFLNTERALAPALDGQVDLVVHGGDLLYRSRVPVRLVDRALEPLLQVADRGVPVVLVPGNHERGALPFPVLGAHEHLHILDRPKTLRLEVGGLQVAVAGFPCVRDGIRDEFNALVRATGVFDSAADIRLLCLHQSVEGATVGPAGYVFRSGPDIIRGRDIPPGFCAVLSGHIHRAQVLTEDLAGRPLPSPVFYPGAVERTSYAERDEVKGYMVLELGSGGAGAGCLVHHAFRELPTRPLVDLEVEATGLDHEALVGAIRFRLSNLDPDSVVRVAITGSVSAAAKPVLSAAELRALAPPTMTVSLRHPQ